MLLVATALAQDGSYRGFGGFGGFGPRRPFVQYSNLGYDGRFTFVRLKYETPPGGYWYGGWPIWAHGYPLAEQNLMRIMDGVSVLGAHEDTNSVTLDDPELLRYPLAYVIQVGWWLPTDREAAALRAYLLKGGFVIVDDFKVRNWGGGRGGGGWENFESSMKRVLPEGRFLEMEPSHPIFHSFFEIDSFDIIPQA